jgi:tetratricopeptide (TPR) repeat protein
MGKSRPPRLQTTKAVVSGAVGGPSTGHGMNYQNLYAVLRALDLIDRCLATPYRAFTISIEPRTAFDGKPTAWDICTQPDDSFYEVKLNPTRSDVLDWIERSGTASGANPTRIFSLVYSTASGPILASVQQLMRIAVEAVGDKARFNRLIELEEARDAGEICAKTSAPPHEFLTRIRLVQEPESGLDSEIDFRARRISGEKGGKRLRQFLFQKFVEAVPGRKSFDIGESIEELRKEGVEFQPPPEVAASDLSSAAAGTIFLLQTCQSGIPAEAIAQTFSTSVEDLAEQLLPLREKGILSVQEGLWTVRPLPSQVTVHDAANLWGRLLEALLAYIHTHRNAKAGRKQVLNAVEIARKCSTYCQPQVAQVFRVLDKLLKRRGDKHLVLEVADLSIGAARRPEQIRSQEVVKGEAVALICGRSWVYQRIGRLSEAQSIAQQSLDLGESVGWDRNTAYCMKCIGRLYRMQAETETDKLAKTSLLAKSVASLLEGIQKFSDSAEFGPNDPEVGDCYSLLGRTYVVSGDLRKATEVIGKASELITDHASKDFLDLLILRGDLAVAKGNRELADSEYQDALSWSQDGGVEVSEMLARANFKCGLNDRAIGKKVIAAKRMRRAAEIWHQLGEHETAAEAEWNEILLVEELPANTIQILERQKFAVRVAAVRSHQRLLEGAHKSRARRADPSEQYWDQRIKEAREQVALEVKSW